MFWHNKKEFKEHVESVMTHSKEYWGHKHQLLIRDNDMAPDLVYHVGDIENVCFTSFADFDRALDFFIKCEDIRF